LNTIELLMAEHISLRLRFRMMREDQNWNSIYQVEEFVRSCHAKVEDEIVFPILKKKMELVEKGQVVTNVLIRLEADHKLIDKIGEQIRLRTVEGDSELLGKRIALYCSTVETHNTAEETQIFSHWRNDFEGIDTRERVMKIMKEFGLSRYYEITGTSEELIRLFEKREMKE